MISCFGQNYTPSYFLPDSNVVYRSGDPRIFSQSHPPPLINEHKHPFGSTHRGPVTQYWNVLQTAHNACNSKDVDALKFQLARQDTFYNGQNQQDSTECVLMLINIIHKGSMPDSSSTTSPTVLLYLTSCFHLFWKNILSMMYVDWGPPHLSLLVLYILPTDTSSMQNLILDGSQ